MQFSLPGKRQRLPLVRSLLLVACFCATGVASALPPDEEMQQVPAGLFVEPTPAVLLAAKKAGIRLGHTTPYRTDSAKPGDSIVAVATFLNEGKRRQWLIRLIMDDLTDKEAQSPDGKSFVFYTTTGRSFTFRSKKAAVVLQTIGPLVGNEKENELPEMLEARVLTNEDYLGLGLARAGDFFDEIKYFRTEGEPTARFDYSSSTSPFPESVIAPSKLLADRMGVTEDAERAFTGSLPALLEFFHVTYRTPGIREILLQALDKPSVWSIVKGLGKGAVAFTFEDKGQGPVAPERWNLNLQEVEAIPLTLRIFQKPALLLTLYATDPKPPLRACAGIVGITARSPSQAGQYLVIRLVSAYEEAPETIQHPPPKKGARQVETAGTARQ